MTNWNDWSKWQVQDWWEWTTTELLENPDKAKFVFSKMLERLEADGHCREIYHELAYILFTDSLK